MHPDQRDPSPVLQAHPLLAVPVLVATVYAGIAHGSGAGQLALLVGGGAMLAMDVTARRLVRTAWRRHLWPPSMGSPEALVVVAVGACWAAGWWLVEAPPAQGRGIDAGLRAAWVATGVQLFVWRRASNGRDETSQRSTGPHASDAGRRAP